MRFDIITIFPNVLDAILDESILARAQKEGLIDIQVHDLRKWTTDNRKTIDDKPFGGGPGMLMMIEPIYKALKELGVYPDHPEDTQVVLTSAKGQTWSQKQASYVSENIQRMVIIAGHYEGVDHRVVENLIDQEISIGDYILTGGELPAAVIVDSVSRLIPGVLGNPESLAQESHNDSALEYPQYTRPANFLTEEGITWDVPPILLSGNHEEISKWKKENTQIL